MGKKSKIKEHRYYLDALQEAELIYIEKGLKLEENEKIRWLFKTAKNIISNREKKDNHCICISELLDDDANEGRISVYSDCNCHCSEIMGNLSIEQVLASLNDTDRNIVKMRIEGYHYNEIAEKFNISEDAIYKRMERIKPYLIKMLGGRGGKN